MPGYRLDGQPISSVTEIVGCYKPSIEGLLYWAAKHGSIAEFKARRYDGADIGSAVHDRIEAHLLQKPEPFLTLPPEHMEAFTNSWAAYAEFAAEHYPNVKEVIGVEKQMLHELKRFGGTADLIVRLQDDSLQIWDWKTSKVYDPERQSSAYESQQTAYRLQLAAYRELLRHTTGLEASGGKIIVLRKDTGKPQVYSFDQQELDQGELIFDHLRFVHQSLTPKH